LPSDRTRILIGMTVISHRHDRSVNLRAKLGYRLLQIGREGGDSAAARK
jgi:hypothetical protein